jgi:replicative DNA helicase
VITNINGNGHHATGNSNGHHATDHGQRASDAPLAQPTPYRAAPDLTERMLPADLEAERACLGALLMDRDAIVAVADWLMPDYFYLEKHAWVYEATLACYQARTPPDLRTVSDVLRREGRLEALGGLPFLVALSLATPTAVHVVHYARIVERAGLRRKLIAAGGKIAALGYEEQDDLDVTFGKAQEALLTVTQRAAQQPALDSVALAERAFARWSEAGSPGIATGLVDVDSFTGGVRRKSLTIVAARPSVGKTSWAVQLALNAAQAGQRVLIFSLEMSADEIEDRLAASVSGISMDKIMHKTWTPQEFEGAVRALGELSNLPYAVDSCEDDGGSGESAYTVASVRNRALRLAQEWGRPDLLIVDFLQLLDASSTGRRSENRTQEIDRIVRALKALARALDCAVVCLSQLSREVEKRASHIPVLADLRESGAIEQIADTVIFLHRPILYAQKTPDGKAYDADGNLVDEHLAELHIAKQRNGPIGIIPVWVNLATGRWRDLARSGQVPQGY